jgi:hypothetical protein
MFISTNSNKYANEKELRIFTKITYRFRNAFEQLPLQLLIS